MGKGQHIKVILQGETRKSARGVRQGQSKQKLLKIIFVLSRSEDSGPASSKGRKEQKNEGDKK